MTATENHDESAKSLDFFQDNNAIKKKKKKKKLHQAIHDCKNWIKKFFIKNFLRWYQQGRFLQPKLCISYLCAHN